MMHRECTFQLLMVLQLFRTALCRPVISSFSVAEAGVRSHVEELIRVPRQVVSTRPWTVSEFTECSATCNGGFRTRSVRCLDEDEIIRMDCTMRPESSEFCNQIDCITGNPTPSVLPDSGTYNFSSIADGTIALLSFNDLGTEGNVIQLNTTESDGTGSRLIRAVSPTRIVMAITLVPANDDICFVTNNSQTHLLVNGENKLTLNDVGLVTISNTQSISFQDNGISLVGGDMLADNINMFVFYDGLQFYMFNESIENALDGPGNLYINPVTDMALFSKSASFNNQFDKVFASIQNPVTTDITTNAMPSTTEDSTAGIITEDATTSATTEDDTGGTTSEDGSGGATTEDSTASRPTSISTAITSTFSPTSESISTVMDTFTPDMTTTNQGSETVALTELEATTSVAATVPTTAAATILTETSTNMPTERPTTQSFTPQQTTSSSTNTTVEPISTTNPCPTDSSSAASPTSTAETTIPPTITSVTTTEETSIESSRSKSVSTMLTRSRKRSRSKGTRSRFSSITSFSSGRSTKPCSNIDHSRTRPSNTGISGTGSRSTGRSSFSNIKSFSVNRSTKRHSKFDHFRTRFSNTGISGTGSHSHSRVRSRDTNSNIRPRPCSGRSTKWYSSSDRSSPERSSPDRSSPNRSSPDRSSPNLSSPHRSSSDHSSPHRSTTDRSSPDRSSIDRSSTDYSSHDHSRSDSSSTSRSSPDCSSPDCSGTHPSGPYRSGPDRSGRDRSGRNRSGPDRSGSDGSSPDRSGRDRSGRDRSGRNRSGPDRAGPDRYSPDRSSTDRSNTIRSSPDRSSIDRSSAHHSSADRSGLSKTRTITVTVIPNSATTPFPCDSTTETPITEKNSSFRSRSFKSHSRKKDRSSKNDHSRNKGYPKKAKKTTKLNKRKKASKSH